MDPQNLTLAIALLFGLVSFFSPCVLPLVPVYLGYLSGATVAGADDKGQVPRWYTFSHAAVLVLGFSLIFILLGALGGALGRSLSQLTPTITRVGGTMLVVFGLRVAHVSWSRVRWVVAGALIGGLGFLLSVREPLANRALTAAFFFVVTLAGMSWPVAGHVALGGLAALINFLLVWGGTSGLLGFSDIGGFTPTLTALVESGVIWLLVAWASRTDLFYTEKRLDLGRDRSRGYTTSFLTGIVFGAGWTPCVGPILASIFALTLTGQSVARGALLLTFYSVGLGLPFLAAGLAFGQLSNWLPKLNRHLGAISLVSGILLAIVGVVIYTDSLSFLNSAELQTIQLQIEEWLLGVLGLGGS